MKSMAKSQPNLLAMMDDEDDDGEDAPAPIGVGSLRAAVSNPNLLDDEEDAPTPDVAAPKAVAGARRRSALIGLWENRISRNEL